MSEEISKENTIENTIEEKYLIFLIQDKRFALPSKFISEVAVLEKVFPLPLTPDYVKGIINRYSMPYALIDINFLLHKEASKAGKLIILKEEVDKLALMIDDVSDIADLSIEKLLKIDHEDAVSASISSFFEWKGNHVFLFDTEELINLIKRDFIPQAA